MNYNLTIKDQRFLEGSKLEITREDLEKIIDVFEKLAVAYKDQSKNFLSNKFYDVVDKDLATKIQKSTLEAIYENVSAFLSFDWLCQNFQVFTKSHIPCSTGKARGKNGRDRFCEYSGRKLMWTSRI